MKRQIINIIAVALVAILPLGSMFAQAKGQGKFQGRQKMLQELNLTQDQKDQIAKLRLEHQKQMIDYRSDVAKTRLEIKNLFLNKDVNENKVLDLTKKVSDMQADMKASSIKHWFQIYSLLNDQQKETFRKTAPMLNGQRRGEGMKGMRRGRGMMQGKGMMQGHGKMAPENKG
ncbi:MAG: periplasmic heavy metal sensor [Ignavibacteria bacterium]|jgi:Spy/CpxP family protein refolding chaperone|nr:periplasmic heavy metal sensor [Ignavibacteria bacterium]MCU7504432.1 periplasmic heavy metal sensor [Ignavibacteria bacterium]MCU7517477.1 periplasmic heavy metal sensor [Ignavibacteria bacterium]